MVDTDVVVVGAGPAGSMTAQRLAQAGVKVILCEKSDTPGKGNVCAGMLKMSCAREYGVDPAILEKVVHRGIHFFGSATVEIGQPGGYAMILRDRFDRYLADRAASAGAELRTGARVTEVEVIRPGRVHIRCRMDDGRQESLRSSAAVLADGPHTLASRLFPGLGFQRDPENLSFAFSCDVEARGNRMEHFEMYYDRRLADWGYGWVFPKKDLLNAGLICRVPEYLSDKSVLQRRLEYLWNEHPRASAILEGRRLVRKRGAMVPQRTARKLVGDSIIVAGDAAGMADALFGGGIENAMYSGDWAASVLEDALQQGRLDAESLGRGEQRWKCGAHWKMLLAAEAFRDWSCRLDRIRPGLSNRMRYLFALRVKLKLQGKGRAASALGPLFSPALRRSMEIGRERIPSQF
ncbi:MAG: NAD(P)/FAD-dependent oxidoreductase [bacterium]